MDEPPRQSHDAKCLKMACRGLIQNHGTLQSKRATDVPNHLFLFAADAAGAAQWTWLTPEFLGLIAALLGVWVRMEVAIKVLGEKQTKATEDRKDQWLAIGVLRIENSDCNRERGELRARADSQQQQSQQTYRPVDSPHRPARPPRDGA